MEDRPLEKELREALEHAKERAKRAFLEYERTQLQFGADSQEHRKAQAEWKRLQLEVKNLEIALVDLKQGVSANLATAALLAAAKQAAEEGAKNRAAAEEAEKDRILASAEKAEAKVERVAAVEERERTEEALADAHQEILAVAENENRMAARTIFGIASTIVFAAAWILYKQPLAKVQGPWHDALVTSLAVAAVAGLLPSIYHGIAANALVRAAVIGDGKSSQTALQVRIAMLSATKTAHAARSKWLSWAAALIVVAGVLLVLVLLHAEPAMIGDPAETTAGNFTTGSSG